MNSHPSDCLLPYLAMISGLLIRYSSDTVSEKCPPTSFLEGNSSGVILLPLNINPDKTFLSICLKALL